jgi:hypothetical protein
MRIPDPTRTFRQARFANGGEETLYGRSIVYQKKARQMANAQVRGKAVSIMNGTTGIEYKKGPARCGPPFDGDLACSWLSRARPDYREILSPL